MPPEYKEGPESKEKFERTVRTLFQASKPTSLNSNTNKIRSIPARLLKFAHHR